MTPPSAAHPVQKDRRSSAAIEAQVAAFSSIRVQHPVLTYCLDALSSMHAAARHNSGKPRGMLIHGLSGTGKSTVAAQYEKQYPRRDEEERTVIPVLRVELPGQPTAKALSESILMAMGDPLSHRGSAEFRLGRVRTLFKACGVELVIIDECQHMTNNLDHRARDIAADTLKNLMNVTGIPFVFIGTPACSAYFVENQQLGRRCSPKIEVAPFGIRVADERRDFKRLLLSLDRSLPFTESSALIDATLTEALHLGCFGILGILTQLVEAALRITLRSEGSTLGRDSLHQAFAQVIFPRCSPSRNPFDVKFSGKPLTGPGEPFNGFVC